MLTKNVFPGARAMPTIEPPSATFETPSVLPLGNRPCNDLGTGDARLRADTPRAFVATSEQAFANPVSTNGKLMTGHQFAADRLRAALERSVTAMEDAGRRLPGGSKEYLSLVLARQLAREALNLHSRTPKG